MAELFIVRVRLKATLWFVAAAFFIVLFAAWELWRQIEPGEEAHFYLAATVAGVLAIAWVGLLVAYLLVGRFMRPDRWRNSWTSRIQWWAVWAVVLLLLVVAGGMVVHRLTLQTANGFELLKWGRLPELGEYIDQHPEALEQRDEKSGQTLLEAALAKGDVEAVDMLLSREGMQEREDGMAAWLVVAIDTPPMVKTLLRHGADPNQPDEADRLPICYAAQDGNTNALQMLVDAGANVNAPNAAAQTALVQLLLEDNLPAARLLVHYGADPNQTDRSGETALHKAVRRNNPDAVRFLLENGADPAILNSSGRAPIHMAAAAGRKELVEIFLEYPGQLELEDKDGRTPFDQAVVRHRYDTARLLLERGADIDRPVEGGKTIVFLMLEDHDYPAAKFLVREGANVRIPDDEDETAYFYMRKKKLQPLLDLVDERDNPKPEGATNAVESAEADATTNSMPEVAEPAE